MPTRIYRRVGVVASVGRWAYLIRSSSEIAPCCVVYGHRRMTQVWRSNGAVLDVVKRHEIYPWVT